RKDSSPPIAPGHQDPRTFAIQGDTAEIDRRRKGSGFFAVRHRPDLQALVLACRHDLGAVFGQRKTAHRTPLIQFAFVAAVRHIPDLDELVLAPGHHLVALGSEGNGIDRSLMSRNAASLLAHANVVEAYGSIR